MSLILIPISGGEMAIKAAAVLLSNRILFANPHRTVNYYSINKKIKRIMFNKPTILAIIWVACGKLKNPA